MLVGRFPALPRSARPGWLTSLAGLAVPDNIVGTTVYIVGLDEAKSAEFFAALHSSVDGQPFPPHAHGRGRNEPGEPVGSRRNKRNGSCSIAPADANDSL